jgi:transcriptional regulator GlxA family with amidase domain
MRRKPEKYSHLSRQIVFLAAPPIEELDAVGPWEVFATANNALPAETRAYEMHLLTTGRARTFAGDSRLKLTADRHYKSFSGPVDTLIIPGGSGPHKLCDHDVLNWLRLQSTRARRVVSICTGAFLLARAGLLDGKRATTHWKFARELSQQYPSVIVEEDCIYTQDSKTDPSKNDASKIYTSAGVTAGMDVALALVEEDLGGAIALKVAQSLVLFLRRPGGQAQFSTLLSSPAGDSWSLRDLMVWMAENLRRDLSVESLASRAAMSPRNFARVFGREVGTTPARFVEQLRIESARRSLETGSRSLDEVAASAGFPSAELMRRAFHRSLGISPGVYRDRVKRGSNRIVHGRG